LLALLQCGPEECVHRSLRRFHAESSTIDDLLTRLAERRVLRSLPLELRTTAGEIKPVLVDANAFWEHGRLVHSRWFVRDISQRKRLEREVLELSDRERQSFAQELHDGLGQQLGGIAYLTNVLHEQLVERRAPEAAEAERIFVLVRNAIEQARRLARGLSPIRAESEGLMDALRELADHTREVFGVDCRFRNQRTVLVDDPVVAGHLYRIAQEAVNNAVKHAEAKSIRIRLQRRTRHLRLTVQDDGKGLGPLPPRRSGLGLRIMQYRADLVRGQLKIGPQRARSRGTEVSCSVPEGFSKR
jgi:signal transduction histidine kinase